MLTYILYNWSSLKSDTDLVLALKECAFVAREHPAGPTGSQLAAVEEELVVPSQLYDPLHALYGPVFVGAGRFPAGQFAFPAWLEVSCWMWSEDVVQPDS